MKKLKILFCTDLREKILYILLMVILFRVLSHIPVPFVDLGAISMMGNTDFFGLINLYSGGALQNFTIMATGISAYISASIIIQMLSYFVPSVHMMVRSPGGDRKVKKITIVLGIITAVISSIVTTYGMDKAYGMLNNHSWYAFAIIAVLHAFGTGIGIWIGESITEKTFVNGMSLLVCINVVSSIPTIIQTAASEDMSVASVISMVFLTTITILLTIIAETSERRIPLFYPKAAARGKFSKESMYFPIKLNLSGVMPIILAGYVVTLLSMFGKMKNKAGTYISAFLDQNNIWYTLVFALMVYLFTYLYASISFDARETSENIQKNGAVIPTIRPGRETAEYIKDARKSITRISAIYLALIYFVPTAILTALGIHFMQASSIIILVGVSIETCKSLKVEMELRDYKTF